MLIRVGIGLLLAAGVASAQIQVITECDRLAADGDDPRAVAPGVAAGEIEAVEAVTACVAAIDSRPSVARFHYQYGRALESAGKDSEAVFALRRAVAADPGYTAAMTALGRIHEEQTPPDWYEVVEWYERAAEAGSAQAQYRLAVLLLEGRGVAPDEAHARRLFEEAATQQHPASMGRLGLLLAESESPADQQRARELLAHAAGAGVSGVCRGLAILYDRGLGGPADQAEALRWYRKAGGEGDVAAAARLAEMLERGEGTAANPAEAVKLYRWVAERSGEDAGRWYERAAKLGDARSQVALGRLHARGAGGVARNPQAAAELFEQAAKQKDPEAMVALGDLYRYDDRDGFSNRGRAISFYKDAAKRNFAKAFTRIGTAHEEGFGVGRNEKKALENLRRGAELGDDEAMLILARRYVQGGPGGANPAEALAWARKAHQKGNAQGTLLLAQYLEKGVGGPPDGQGAARLYRTMEKESALARQRLGQLYAQGLARPPMVAVETAVGNLPTPISYRSSPPPAAAPKPAPVEAARPAPQVVSDVMVEAKPEVVPRKQTVELVLRYLVSAAGPVEVVEKRVLLLGGVALPNYPVVSRYERTSGRYATSFSQQVPAGARAGSYEYRAEVCAEERCVSGAVRFTVQ